MFNLRRLRLADGLPVAVEQVWLSREQFSGLDQIDLHPPLSTNLVALWDSA